VVVGTAGHIDHGKSALVEALTGTHPDRWREERERGITLDLGYAQLAFPDGTEIGFVDVPGHERLVRKMVAGATGMGAAMLVVACDDGVMPQTREHFEVLQLLGVRHGLVALTKADLAGEEVRELVRADVEALLEGTAWEGAPLVAVSAQSGEGLGELRAALRALAARAGPGVEAGPRAFRLPVQRAFSLHGAGTVVTGVTACGSLREGAAVEILPAGKRSRVRRVQVHGRNAGAARPGLRTALNLPGIGKADCPRGSVVAVPGTLRAGRLLRALLEPLPGGKPLRHGSPVQVLAGTAAVVGRMFLPAERAEAKVLADLELAEPMALAPGERLLLRRPSPAANLGSGFFLAFGTRRLRRRDGKEREALLRFAAALEDPPLLAACVLELLSEGSRKAAEVAAFLGWRVEAAAENLERAAAGGAVRATGGGGFVAAGEADDLAREVRGILEHFRNKHPFRLRIPLEVLRSRLGKTRFHTLERLPDAALEAIGLRRRAGTAWEIPDAGPPVDYREQAERLLAILEPAGLAPPDFASLSESLGVSPGRVGEVAVLLCDSGRAFQPLEGLLFSRRAVEALRDAVVAALRAGSLDIPALRDRFHTTRKYLMPLLEFLDERGVTTRRGPNRILRDPEAPLA